MAEELPVRRVEVGFAGSPPVQSIERASGVSEVEVDGPVLRCLVCGSFQPFLEALRGYEVISLESTRTGIEEVEDGTDRPGVAAFPGEDHRRRLSAVLPDGDSG